MLTEQDLSPDQTAAIDYLYDHDHTFLLAGMGSGKTIVALSAAEELLEDKVLRRVLILAPLKVCNEVWATEADNWLHLQGLRVTVATGDAESRKQAILKGGEVVVMNFDNLPWLMESGMYGDFDGLIVDESTKLKGGGVGFKQIRHKISGFKWRVCMTGTPVSENWTQLFYQMFIVDNGAALGRNRDKFLRRFFYPTDYEQRNWEVLPGREAALVAAIREVVHVIPDYHHDLPELVIHPPVMVPLPPPVRAVYTQMENTMEALGVLADNGAVRDGKLQQIAAGFLYDDDEVHDLHDQKVQKVLEILGKRSSKIGKTVVEKPTLIVYQYDWELEQLQEALPDAVHMTRDNTGACVADWNAGRLNAVLLHPKSAGHGLNLQAGGSRMIWLGPVWSRDLWLQTIARLWRRGQRSEVDVWRIETVDTIDQRISERVDLKGAYMTVLLDELAS